VLYEGKPVGTPDAAAFGRVIAVWTVFFVVEEAVAWSALLPRGFLRWPCG
jgi:hypothetical protein